MASGCFGLRLRRGSVEGMFANARWPLMFLRRFSRACVHFRTYFFRASDGKETRLSSREVASTDESCKHREVTRRSREPMRYWLPALLAFAVSTGAVPTLVNCRI